MKDKIKFKIFKKIMKRKLIFDIILLIAAIMKWIIYVIINLN